MKNKITIENQKFYLLHDYQTGIKEYLSEDYFFIAQLNSDNKWQVEISLEEGIFGGTIQETEEDIQFLLDYVRMAKLFEAKLNEISS